MNDYGAAQKNQKVPPRMQTIDVANTTGASVQAKQTRIKLKAMGHRRGKSSLGWG